MPLDIAAAEPIAIVGLGAMFPGRGDTLGYWRDIMEGVDAVGPPPPSHWLVEDYYDPDPRAPDKTYGRTGGFLKPRRFDPLAFGVPPATLPATDTVQLLALMVAKEALDQACATTLRTLSKERVSVILGVASATELVAHMSNRLQRPVWLKAMREAGLTEEEADDIAQSIADHYVPWQEATFPGLLGNVVAGRIANRLDLGGCNYVTDAACASSLSALQAALYELYSGNSDAVLAGGADALNDILMYMCFSKTPALSPSGDCRPFSDKADGTVLGEGIGIVALRRLSDAERDGNIIYAVIRGLGSGSDGRATAIYAPLAQGQARALRRAYDAASVRPSTVELVEAHGTGTKAGDAAELSGLRLVYEEDAEPGARWASLGSVKSQIGHTKAAAGAASLIKTALALHHKVLPPTVKVDRPNPALGLEDSPFHLNTQARPWVRGSDHPRRAAVSSFGFGGSNFHAVLEEYLGPNPAPRFRALPAELALLSADTGDQLARAARDIAAAATDASDLARVVTQTHAAFRTDHPHRLAIVARTGAELADKLTALAELDPARWGAAPDPDIAYGRGAPADGDVAFLFPGQGSQHVGMGGDLAMAFEDARAVWDRAADHPSFQREPLHSLTFPIPAFDDAGRAEAEARLTRMENAQPGLAATSLSMLVLLKRLGLTPDMVAGHSFGELVALHAAGVFDETTLLTLSGARGAAMADAAAGADGAMSAVSASGEAVRQQLVPLGDRIVLANDNAPDQVVISGAVKAIERAEAVLADAGLQVRRLPVASAFHSPIVSAAVDPFARALGEQTFAAPSIPVFSNVTASRYPHDAAEMRALLADQLSRPVRFREQVEAMYAAGARTFIEVGPSAVLTGLARRCLDGRGDAQVVPLAHRRQNGVHAFWRGVAALAASGAPLALHDLLADAPPAEASAAPSPHAVELTGANYAKPYPPAPGADMSPPTIKTRPSTRPAAPAGEQPTTPRPEAVPASTPAPAAAPDGGVVAELSRVHAEYLRATTQAHEAFMSTVKAVATGGDAPVIEAPAGRAPAVEPRPEPPTPPAEAASTPRPRVEDFFPETPSARPSITPPSPPVDAGASGDVADVIRELVAEKAGYPVDMLDDAMDLEGELGVDSIKQVEILAALRERAPDLPEIDPSQLAELRSIAAIAEALGGAATPPAQPAAPPVEPAQPAEPAPAMALGAETSGLVDLIRGLVAEKTGYPADMLDDTMDLEGELGVDSIKQVEILAALRERAPELPEIDPGQLAELRSIGAIAAALGEGSSPAAAAAPLPPSSPAPDVSPVPMSAPAPAAGAAPASDLANLIRALVAEKTGYPADMLDDGMDLEGELGVDSIKQVEILAALRERAPALPEIDPSQLAELRTIAAIANALASEDTETAAPPADGPASRGDADPVGAMTLHAVERPASGFAMAGLLTADAVEVTDDGGEVAAELVEALAMYDLPAALVTAPSGDADMLIVTTGLMDAAADDICWRALSHAKQAAPGLGRAGAGLVTVQASGGSFGVAGGDADAAWRGGLTGLAKTAASEWPDLATKSIDIVVDGISAREAARRIADELRAGGPEPEVGLPADGRRLIVQETDCALQEESGLVRDGMVVVAVGGARGVTAGALLALAARASLRIALIGRSQPAPWPADLDPSLDEQGLRRALAMRARAAGEVVTPAAIAEETRALLAGRDIERTEATLKAAGAEVMYLAADAADADAVASALRRVRARWGRIDGLVHAAGVLADKRIADQTEDRFVRVFEPKVGGLAALLDAVEHDDLQFLALFSSVAGRYGNEGQAAYAMANETLARVGWAEARRRPDCLVKVFDWGPWDGGMVGAELRALFESRGVGLIAPDTGAEFFAETIDRGAAGDVELIVGPSLASPRREWRADVSVHADDPILSDHVIAGKPVLPAMQALAWMVRLAEIAGPQGAPVRIDAFAALAGVTLGPNQDTLRLRVTAEPDVVDANALELTLRTDDGRVRYRARARWDVREVSHAPDHAEGAAWAIEPEEAYEALFHGPTFHTLEDLSRVGESGAECWLGRDCVRDDAVDVALLDGGLQAAYVWGLERLGGGTLPTAIAHATVSHMAGAGRHVRCVLRSRLAGSGKAVHDIAYWSEDGRLIALLEGVEMCAAPTLALPGR